MPEPTAFDTFLAARYKLLQEENPPEHGEEEGWRAIFSPQFLTRLLAESRLDGGGGLPPQNVTPTITGIPFTVSCLLPANHLAILFCGRDPFDPQHPEHTVVITERRM